MRCIGIFALLSLSVLAGTGCSNKEPDIVAAGPNSDPVIKSVTVIPEAIRIGESCILRCDAVDSDNDQLEYEWDAGIGTISGKGEEVFYTANGCCSAPFLNLTVRDGRGGETTQMIIVPLRVVD